MGRRARRAVGVEPPHPDHVVLRGGELPVGAQLRKTLKKSLD